LDYRAVFIFLHFSTFPGGGYNSRLAFAVRLWVIWTSADEKLMTLKIDNIL